jgi:hypothetical protein
MGLLKTIIIISVAFYLKSVFKHNIDKIGNYLHNIFKNMPYYDLLSAVVTKYKDISDAYILLIIIVIIMALFY